MRSLLTMASLFSRKSMATSCITPELVSLGRVAWVPVAIRAALAARETLELKTGFVTFYIGFRLAFAALVSDLD